MSGFLYTDFADFTVFFVLFTEFSVPSVREASMSEKVYPELTLYIVEWIIWVRRRPSLLPKWVNYEAVERSQPPFVFLLTT